MDREMTLDKLLVGPILRPLTSTDGIEARELRAAPRGSGEDAHQERPFAPVSKRPGWRARQSEQHA